MATQTYNYVSAHYPDGTGRTVFSPDGKTRLEVDHSRPITLARCAEIHAKACALAQQALGTITIKLSVYECDCTPADLMDCTHRPVVAKSWVFTPRHNSLVVWDRDTPVYANDNGRICRDQVALADTLL
jgi:hypothetical protein